MKVIKHAKTHCCLCEAYEDEIRTRGWKWFVVKRDYKGRVVQVEKGEIAVPEGNREGFMEEVVFDLDPEEQHDLDMQK